MRTFLACAVAVAFWFAASPAMHAFTVKSVCVTVEKVRLCVQPRGTCTISQVIGEMESDFPMEMFQVSISNRSQRRVKILPEHFYGITEDGFAVVLDAPLFESIELRSKLRRQDIPPNGETEGVLFLPAVMGRIQTIVYAGNPVFEVKLF